MAREPTTARSKSCWRMYIQCPLIIIHRLWQPYQFYRKDWCRRSQISFLGIISLVKEGNNYVFFKLLGYLSKHNFRGMFASAAKIILSWNYRLTHLWKIFTKKWLEDLSKAFIKFFNGKYPWLMSNLSKGVQCMGEMSHK